MFCQDGLVRYNTTMDIAVLGGTFDPPHFGHLLVARQVLEVKTDIDEVWLMPANTNPDKKVYAPTYTRLAMVKFLQEPRIKVSDIDIIRGGETYTIDTVRQLLIDKKNQYRFVMGSDLLSKMKNWQGYEEIIASIPIIIFPRPDYPVKTIPKSFEILPENQLLVANYSSTVIRQRIAKGLSIKGLVPDKVAEYIKKHQLYQTKTVNV